MNKITNFLTISFVFFIKPIRFLLRYIFIPIFIMIISPYLSMIYSFIKFIFSILRFCIFCCNLAIIYEICYSDKDRGLLIFTLLCYGFLFVIIKKVGRLIIKAIKKIEKIIKQI